MQNDRDKLADQMTIVLGVADQLLEDFYGPLEPEQRRALERLLEAADQAKEIIREDKGAFSFD